MLFYLNGLVLIALLLLSVFFDLTEKKIPNFLTFPAVLWGLSIYTLTGGIEGFLFSFLGLVLGISIFLIPFALGGMGGGDVKLLGAIGALRGWEFVAAAAIFTAICGGLIAVVYLLIYGQLWKTLRKLLSRAAVPLFTALYLRFRQPCLNHLTVYFQQLPEHQEQDAKNIYMPYGVAIAAGTVIVLVGDKLIPVIALIKL